MKKVTVSLASYNGERYLRDFCDSLVKQTYTDWECIVVDNASVDRSVAIINEHIPHATVVSQKSNIGFASAHNQIIRWSKSEYVFVVNQDVVLEPTFLERAVRCMDAYERVAAVGGKLLSWNALTHESLGTIDSCGISLLTSYRAIDRLQGKPIVDMGPHDVFGISGAAVLYRRAALEDVRLPVQAKTEGYFEYFDEDYFMYKEDVDLAWRLRSRRWRAMICPSAVAYHVRSVSSERSSWKDRRLRNAINVYSYRNHLLTVYKNQWWTVTVRHLLPILFYELKKFIALALIDRSSIVGLVQAVRLFPKMRRKRALIVRSRNVSAKTFNQWLTTR